MKKILIIPIIIGLLFIAWLGSSWYIGGEIEKQLKQMPEKLAKIAPNDKLNEISYSRGLLTTHVRYGVSNNTVSTVPTIELDMTIWHGPFPLKSLTQGSLLPQKGTAHGDIFLADSMRPAVYTPFGKEPLFSIDETCNFSGECSGSGISQHINLDNLDILKIDKINFDGIKLKYKYNENSFNANVDVELLPLSINNKDMGSGQITVTVQPTNITQTISWKTKQGASNISINGEFSRPITVNMVETMSAADLAELSTNPFKFIKTGSIKADVSKTMVTDLAARIAHLTEDVDLEAARQQISMQFDTTLNSFPDVKKYIAIQDDKITTDWSYTGDKLIINGKENPEMLAAIKSGALSMIPKDAIGESTGGSNENQIPEQGDADGDGDKKQ
jgi:uncharacterized protein YdgA (DUF945 family)